MKFLLWCLVIATVVACGRCGNEPVHFVTREIPEAESDVPWDGNSDVTEAVNEHASGVMSNTLAGLVQKVLPSSGTDLAPTILGHALPDRARVFDMTGCREKTKGYEKKLTSLLGADLIRLEYRVSYLYGCQHQGKGQYLGNVRFTPIHVKTDPLWSLTASAVSQVPVNAGSTAAPVAKLGFAITFSAGGVGSRLTTDEFTVEAKSGELTAEIRQFD